MPQGRRGQLGGALGLFGLGVHALVGAHAPRILHRRHHAVPVLLGAEPHHKALVRDDLRRGGVALHVLRIADEIGAVVPDAVEHHESPQVLHAAALVEEGVDAEGVGLVRGDGGLSRRTLRRGLLSGGRGGPGGGGGRLGGFFRAASALNFIDQAINFVHNTVDRHGEGFPVFYLLDLPAEEVHGLEDHVEQLRPQGLRHHVDGLLPDDEEEILDPVGHRHEGVELHHGRGTLDRVHDTEDLVDAVVGERIRLLGRQQDPVELLEKRVRLIQIHIQDAVVATAHISHLFIKIEFFWCSRGGRLKKGHSDPRDDFVKVDIGRTGQKIKTPANFY